MYSYQKRKNKDRSKMIISSVLVAAFLLEIIVGGICVFTGINMFIGLTESGVELMDSAENVTSPLNETVYNRGMVILSYALIVGLVSMIIGMFFIGVGAHYAIEFTKDVWNIRQGKKTLDQRVRDLELDPFHGFVTKHQLNGYLERKKIKGG